MWKYVFAACVGGVVCAAVLAILYTGKLIDFRAFRRMSCRAHNGTVQQRQLIPKKIYRTWKTETLPPIFQTAWEYTATHNPEYEQILYTDTMARHFMRSFMNGFCAQAYNMLVPGAARADLLRYCLLYEYGGVYLDGKSGAGPLRKLIRGNDKMLVSAWGQIVFPSNIVGHDFGELQQWWLAAAPKHPAMKRIIESIVNEIHERAKHHIFMKKTNLGLWSCGVDVLRLTGPLKFTSELLRYVDEGGAEVRVVCGDGNGIMVYDVSGKHNSGGSYDSPGRMLRDPNYMWSQLIPR